MANHKSIAYWHIKNEQYYQELNIFMKDIEMHSKNYKKPSLIYQLEDSREDFIKRFVMDTVTFHLGPNKDSLSFDIIFCICDNVVDEFSVESRVSLVTNNMQYPELSIITYISDTNNFINIFTEMTSTDFNYKKFTNQSNIFFNFPKKNTQITFNGGCIHGNVRTSLDARHSYSIKIYVYDKEEIIQEKKSDLSLKTYNVLKIESQNENILTKIKKDVFTWNFLNNLLYNKSLKQIFEDDDYDTEKCFHLIMPTVKLSDVPPRFIQRYKMENVFQSYIRTWITHEMNKNEKKEPCLNIEKNLTIFNFLLIVSNVFLLPKLCEFYGLDKKCDINITNILFMKLDAIDLIEQILFKSKLIIILSLSGFHKIVFEDGITLSISAGDAVIFSAFIHSKYKVLSDSAEVFIITTEF